MSIKAMSESEKLQFIKARLILSEKEIALGLEMDGDIFMDELINEVDMPDEFLVVKKAKDD